MPTFVEVTDKDITKDHEQQPGEIQEHKSQEDDLADVSAVQSTISSNNPPNEEDAPAKDSPMEENKQTENTTAADDVVLEAVAPVDTPNINSKDVQGEENKQSETTTADGTGTNSNNDEINDENLATVVDDAGNGKSDDVVMDEKPVEEDKHDEAESAASTQLEFSTDENDDDADENEHCDDGEGFNPAEMHGNEDNDDDDGETTATEKSSHGGESQSVASVNTTFDTCFYCKDPVRIGTSLNPYKMTCACCRQYSKICKDCLPLVIDENAPMISKSISSLYFNKLETPMYCSKCRQDCFWCKVHHESK